MKNVLTLTLVLLCTACTANNARELMGSAIANAADTEVGYSQSQCFKVRTQCVEGHYEEWQTSDGVPGCSCKK